MAVNATNAGQIPSLDDLYLFRQQQASQGPPPAAGAAMLALLDVERFPPFAMAFFDVLEPVGRDHPPPVRLALVADDAILLAPSPTATGWRGFLVAEDTASGQVREFRWPGDPLVVGRFVVPTDESSSAVWAAAAAQLTIAESPDTPDSP